MGWYKKKYQKKSTTTVVIKQPEKLQQEINLEHLLSKGRLPIVTFYFKPHAIHATAKDNEGNIKPIKTPTKQVILNKEFLKDFKNNNKTAEVLLADIKCMAHDFNAIDFTI